jgi:Glycosyl hydrolase family 79 C-terminal beta domain
MQNDSLSISTWMCRVRNSGFAAVAMLLAAPLFAQTSASISIDLDSTQLRRAIPNDFLGLSLEMSSIEAGNNNGSAWLSGTSTAYSTMVQKIGVGSIRIGGNSSERQPYATTQDGENVDAFANLIGSELIWTVPVKQFYDQSTSVSYVSSLYNDQHVAHNYSYPTNIEIGNEPDNSEDVSGSAISQSTWQSRYDGFSSAFRSQIDSSILSTGPSTAGCCTFSTDFINDSTYQGSLKSTIGYVTTHFYPAGNAADFGSVSAGDAKLLASSLDSQYQTFYNNFNDNASNTGYSVRIEETNSAFGGSNNGVTNSYAAALWAMDYFCYMAYKTNLSGMNLHTGPIGSNAGSYNAISPVGVASSYTLEPPGYGLWAFHFGSQGQPLSTTVSNPGNVNVSAYGLLESNGGETVHIINKTFGSGAANVTATITPGGTYTNAQVIVLKQANNDVTALSGITFGGQPMNSDGTWTGGYGSSTALTNGTFTFTLPAAQAAIVHFF